MRKFLSITALSLALAAPLFAESASDLITEDTELGTTVEMVTESLESMGFEVRKTETEDDKLEVYFVGNDIKGEVYVSTETGKPTKILIE